MFSFVQTWIDAAKTFFVDNLFVGGAQIIGFVVLGLGAFMMVLQLVQSLMKKNPPEWMQPFVHGYVFPGVLAAFGAWLAVGGSSAAETIISILSNIGNYLGGLVG